MDFINQFCAETPAADGFSKKHPLGSYDGVVTRVAQGYNKKLYKDYWDIEITTAQGAAPSVTIFGFNPTDIAQIQQDQKVRDRAQATISRLKSMLSGVLGLPKQQVDCMGWDELINLLGSLMGKGVKIEVVVDAKDSKYHRTYINGPAERPVAASHVVPLTSSQPQYGNALADHAALLQALADNIKNGQSGRPNNSFPGSGNSPSAPGGNVDLVDVPF